MDEWIVVAEATDMVMVEQQQQPLWLGGSRQPTSLLPARMDSTRGGGWVWSHSQTELDGTHPGGTATPSVGGC